MTNRMHAHEVVATPDQVRALIADQFPEWSRMSVTPVEIAGSDQALFRLGEGLVARMPRIAAAADSTPSRPPSTWPRSSGPCARSTPPGDQPSHRELGCGEDEWRRGRGWALAPALVGLGYCWETFPPSRDLAQRTIAAVTQEFTASPA